MSAIAQLRIPRWIQLVSVPLVAIALWQIGQALQATLLVFVVSALIALLLNPIVASLVRMRIPRGLAILLVYVVSFTIIIGLLAVAGAVVITQTQGAAEAVQKEFQAEPGSDRTPADAKMDDLQRWLDRHGLERVHVRPLGQQAIAKIRDQGVSSYIARAVDVGTTIATAVVTGVFHLILILVISVYMLLDAPRLARYVNRVLPPAPDGRELGQVVQRRLAGYVRGQLIVSFIIGASAGMAMEVFGLLGIWPAARSYAIFFALWAMLTEAIPYVGPVLGAVPPIVLALFDDPLTAVWVALAFLLIHQLEGHVIVPRVMGSALRSHPLGVIFGLLAGAELYGVPGALLALPILAVLTAVYEFLQERITFEPWPATGMVGAGLDVAAPVVVEAPATPDTTPSDPTSIVPRPPHAPARPAGDVAPMDEEART
jgi:predicted PurR-regulated permease PerM